MSVLEKRKWVVTAGMNAVVAVDIFIWESVVSLIPDHADVLLAV